MNIDLKQQSIRELKETAAGIRKKIISAVARNGGHLASNLGAVEIQIALAYVFDISKDAFYFDVGHQAYTWKLLAGREARFDTLRKRGGISGFPSRSESQTDQVSSGHASTAISAALGHARARDLLGGKENVIAIVGDGALTGGMSYEALNDAGSSETSLIVVLNDNRMSISRNVGALTIHLARIRRTRAYLGFKRRTRLLLEKIPLIGKPLFHTLEHCRDILKVFLLGQNLFEDMGFTYIGPVDGHDLKKLIRAFREAGESGGRILVHTVTKKGKGFGPAERDPMRFHGPGPFNEASGEPLSGRVPTYGDMAAAYLDEQAKIDRTICAITAAMPGGTGFSVFQTHHPDRFFDVGIAEEHAVTMAAGLADRGMRPYVCIYSTFLQRAYDQIVNDICINRVPVTFLVDRAGLNGPDGATHNGAFDLSFLCSIPNMTVAAPRDKNALLRLLRFSRDFAGPLAIRYPKEAEDLGPAFRREEPVTAGKWEKLLDGSVSIIATGRAVAAALKACITLHGKGISAGVIDAMFIKPLDTGLLETASRSSKAIITIEENSKVYGLGSLVAEALAGIGADVPLLTLGIPDRFIAHATVPEQQRECGLDPEGIALQTERFLQEKGLLNVGNEAQGR